MSSINAMKHNGISRACCVVVDERNDPSSLAARVIYAGPIATAQVHIIEGTLVLLHPDDFEKLKGIIQKERH